MLKAQIHAPPEADPDIVAALAVCARDLGVAPDAIQYVEAPAGAYSLGIHQVADPIETPPA